MKITNKLGLPQSFVDMASQESSPEDGVYRVTSLLKGIRENILERRHHGEIENDVSDMIWMLFGTAAHNVLEHQQEGADEIKETRLKVEVDGVILSGQFDLYSASTELVTDYKTASVWKIIYENYDDWRRQLSIYGYMLRMLGFPVRRGEIIAILKDHSKRDAKFKPDYPPLPVQKVGFDFSDDDFAETEVWVIQRLRAVRDAERLPDDKLPICTAEERYNSGDKYAVMKKGRKTALRVLDSMEEAEQWKAANSGDEIQVRPGEDKKCIDYCNVNEFCSYYRERVKKDAQS